jgi:hypothetical protein
MNKKSVVRLSDAERGVCQEILKHLKGSSQKFRRAQMLLKANADGPGWPEVRMAEACNGREQTLEHLRKRLVTEGFAWALEGKRRRAPPTVQARWRGGSEVDCQAAGEPARRIWTRDLATPRRCVSALGNRRCDSSRDGPQGTKKNGMTKRTIASWGMPPEQDAECVAGMAEGLATYTAAYDPQHPVLGMDEPPIPLRKETRVPIAATKKHGKRVDYAYERADISVRGGLA